MKTSSKKYALIAGTLLLTATGLATRVLGFFYRIFLSRAVGAEGLGLYNMVHPVYGICFAICAGSVQTAISQSVAANMRKGKAIFRSGLVISLSASLALAVLICHYADFLASHLLLEPRCGPLLVYMAVSVPFSAIHACINGYYYGMQKTRVPAFAQVAEQTIRIGVVFLLADMMMEAGITLTVQLAVMGHLVGEMASALYTVVSYRFFPPKTPGEADGSGSLLASFRDVAGPLMVLALPLMGNRLVLNLLHSAEAIWIPNRLGSFGLSSKEAYSVYGVLTGMALPFILFPSAISNSLAVLLLPAVAEAQSDGNGRRIQAAVAASLRYSMYMGILCIGIFLLFGDALGLGVFHDRDAGKFITILAWLCPFLYLSTTMGSILNGLGKTRTTFLQNGAAMVLRLGFVLAGIPRFGIMAYLWGLLASQLALALMHLVSLGRLVEFSWNAWDMVAKPVALLMVSIGIYRAFASICGATGVMGRLPLFIQTGFYICLIGASYGGMLLLFHFRKKRE